ncbi:NucA/NucB deoxyribonuclease domain-containing protein [Streptomyces sp. BRA346]|uniref:NucA/NucB deoxyribonuclease domain-containing protein n=1 Tax=Streptomyces sp. BRA346 TaxID=2878199 RepID=UPI004064BB8E
MQADEYPFATTEEGLSRARSEDGILDGSVAWTHGNQNGTAGNRLQDFYRTDRILFGGNDEFWVNIEP